MSIYASISIIHPFRFLCPNNNIQCLMLKCSINVKNIKKIVLKFRCVRQNAGTNMAFILVVVRFDDEIFQNT